MDCWKRGCVQIYTGNGKGKTTAALGLTLRAVGAGMKVYFGQFIKGRDCAEIEGLRMLGDNVTLDRFGSGRWIDPSKVELYKEEIELARNGILSVKRAVESGQYQLVVLDEALGAIKRGVLELDDIISIINTKPPMLELIITGRDVPQKLVDVADLVSDISPVKHYYDAGIPARKGIEF